MLLRPIFCEKLKIAPPPIGKQPPMKRLNFGFRPKNQTQFRRRPFFFFFFWRPPDFGRKKPSNFREISSEFSDKPCETDSRTMKIRVKIVCTFLTLSKWPPPFSKSWLRAWLLLLLLVCYYRDIIESASFIRN